MQANKSDAVISGEFVTLCDLGSGEISERQLIKDRIPSLRDINYEVELIVVPAVVTYHCPLSRPSYKPEEFETEPARIEYKIKFTGVIPEPEGGF